MVRTVGMVDYSRCKPAPVASALSLAHALSVSELPPPPPSAPASAGKSKRVEKAARLKNEDVEQFVEDIFGESLHAKRVLALASGVLGVTHAASLAVSAIGRGLAEAKGLIPKHAIKQVDRLLSNKALDLDELLPLWVSFVIAERKELLVTLDWTDFDADGQTTLCLNLATTHGRATPLMWKTVPKRQLKDHRNEFEDALLERFHDLLPLGVKVTLLADRAFGDEKLYRLLQDYGFDFVIRFRGVIHVELDNDGGTFPASALVPGNGTAKLYRNAKVTAKKTPVAGVVCVKKRGMKDAWHLATSLGDISASELVKFYARRFTTEENFRDTKDTRFGLGLSAAHFNSPVRRDRALLLAAMTEALLTLLGAAAEQAGLDRYLKSNTSKKRQHSLFNQGMYWYGAIPAMRDAWIEPLMVAFSNLLAAHPNMTQLLSVI